MCPHTCVTNLPKPREVHSDVGPASVIVGNLVQGNRLAAAAGRDIGGLEDETGDVGGGGKKYQFIAEILRWRAQVTSSTHSIISYSCQRSSGNCRPQPVHPSEQSRSLQPESNLQPAAQESGEDCLPPAGERSAKHGRPCCTDLPTRGRPHLLFLWLPLCRRRTCHHTTTSSSKPTDNTANSQDDRGRLKVCRHPLLSPGDQAAEVEGGEQRCRHKILAADPRHRRAASKEASWSLPSPHCRACCLP